MAVSHELARSPLPPPPPPRRTRRGRWLLVATLLIAAVAATSLVLKSGPLASLLSPDGCTATVGDRTVTLSPEQAVNAATIAAVATQRGLPARASTIALAAAYQESGLRNLDGGDRDSAGLFQQRPSQGWGSHAQVTDPVYASGRFFDQLVKVDGYTSMQVTAAAQAVQRSAFPGAYADHEADARVLASALSGSSAASLTCSVTPPSVAAQAEGPSGLTARTTQVRKQIEATFGAQSLGGFAPGGVNTGHIEGSAHYDGRALDVFFRPHTDPAEVKAGWALAQWLVVNAERLELATVIYDDHIWTAARSREGWRSFTPTNLSSNPKTAAIQRHLDHVHVDVLRGS